MPWLMKQLQLRSSAGPDRATPTRAGGVGAAGSPAPVSAQHVLLLHSYTFPEWRSIFRMDTQVSHLLLQVSRSWSSRDSELLGDPFSLESVSVLAGNTQHEDPYLSYVHQSRPMPGTITLMKPSVASELEIFI